MKTYDLIESLRVCAGPAACLGCEYNGTPDDFECYDQLRLDAANRLEEFLKREASEMPLKAVQSNAVEHPSHYNTGSIEVWDAITDWGLDFLLGNVIKYVARAGHKGDRLEDLRKAKQYIEKAIEVEQGKC